MTCKKFLADARKIYNMTFLLFQGLKNITAMAFDCAICENLKSFFRNKPPMVLFVISLGTFALVLLTLAYIIKVQELPNPDLTKVQTTELILVLGFLFGFFFFLSDSSNMSCTILLVELVWIFFSVYAWWWCHWPLVDF